MRKVINYTFILIALFIMHKIFVNYMTDNEDVSGTFISVFISNDTIYLFSDGRIVNEKKEIISNTFSKIHKLTTHVGMLTAGRYLNNLTQNINNKCEKKGIVFCPDVANEVNLALIEKWEQYCNNPKNKNQIKNVRVFTFIAGYDSLQNAHLYYLDNMTNPPFKIQEYLLFQTKKEVEIGAFSTNEGEGVNSVEMIKKYLITVNQTHHEIFYNAFNKAKEEHSKKTISIGGETFMAKIDFSNGFRLNEN